MAGERRLLVAEDAAGTTVSIGKVILSQHENGTPSSITIYFEFRGVDGGGDYFSRPLKIYLVRWACC